ncbi:MAPEG family protein [Sedimentitalea todarodis]|uniref:MAPEG family protein n=1 Tax=Sedimentitalea todarodis TaxID=1631240 RepID=A0ABU3V921_9RHOB|nr:MAPEG family protein [Sedimentitalea todarodis]MDU9002657.1 MAPEG family protein [Sedimentitalea todarodis]
METFGAYGPVLASVALFAVVVMLFSPLSALQKGKQGLAPGAEPAADYSDLAYRLHRVFENGTDTLSIFLATAGIAVLAGASPFWINLLAALTLASRLFMIFVHVAAIGSPHNGLRSIAYVVGWVCMLAMAILGLVALL